MVESSLCFCRSGSLCKFHALVIGLWDSKHGMQWSPVVFNLIPKNQGSQTCLTDAVAAAGWSHLGASHFVERRW